MAIRDIFKVSRKTFFNPSAWLDYDTLKAQTVNIVSVLRNMFTIPKPAKEETFEAALKRLNITEAEAEKAKTHYRSYALLLTLVALLAFLYSFYLLFTHHSIFTWLLGMAITALFLAKAFQFDFWAFQIKRRKLGATFNEWFEDVFGKKG